MQVHHDTSTGQPRNRAGSRGRCLTRKIDFARRQLFIAGSSSSGPPETSATVRCMARLAIIGRDGRRYPIRPVPDAEVNRVVAIVHALHCRDGLSIRKAQAVMAES